jgi:predicted transcriptional regulator
MEYIEIKKLQKKMKITNITLGKLAGLHPDYIPRLKHREIPAGLITIIQLLEKMPEDERVLFIHHKLKESDN